MSLVLLSNGISVCGFGMIQLAMNSLKPISLKNTFRSHFSDRLSYIMINLIFSYLKIKEGLGCILFLE